MTSNDKVYKYAEKCLYSYRKNEAKALQLREEIGQLRETGDVRCQSYELQSGMNGVNSDPVGRYVESLERLEQQIFRLERKVKPIAGLRQDLKQGTVITVTSAKNLLLVMEGYYFECQTVSRFLSVMRWARSTFFNRRSELLSLTVEYLKH